MSQLQLFSTLGCHLCDDAKAIIEPLTQEYQLSYMEVEISERAEWVKAYGVRIPVVKSVASGKEIGWPFDAVEFEQWLRSIT